MNNEMVLQKLDQGLLTITMNRPDRRNALNPDMTRGLVEAARRAAEDHEVRAGAAQGCRRHLLRRRRCEVDGGGAGAAAVRSQDGQSPARHGSLPHSSRDDKARGGAGRRRGRRRRTFDCARLRSPRRLGFRQDHDRLRQGRLVRRLRRHLFPDPSARQRQGARALSDLAGADGAGKPTRSAW